MDNKQHKNLEKVYNYVASHTISNIAKLADSLSLPHNEILPLISELKLMGLDIRMESNQIQSSSQLDIIDIGFIKEHTKYSKNSRVISKEIVFEFITQSTNQLAQENNKDTIYISDFQSQGKGRQAKKWLTAVGQSIAISISHRFDFGLKELSGLNIVVGVAIIQSLKQFGGKDMGLKWPNDIISPKGKIAGILIEASGNNKSCRAIIGIGINWNIRQALFKSIEQPCNNAGISCVSRTQFIVALILNLNTILKEFTENKLQNIQSLWHQNDAYINEKINIVQGDIIKPATYKGIDKKGLLKVEIKNKLKTVASGEVSIRKTSLHSSTA